MIKVNVNLAERSYPIYISSDYSGLGKRIAAAGLQGKIALITDKNVDKYQSDSVISILGKYTDKLYKYVIEPGEKNKNLDTVKGIYKFLIDSKFDRDSTLVALGGGVVGDITGFAAATFLRGINFVQVPTSLLAQADSSVGGKVGVDFENSKNIIGAFYQPKLVYINVSSLKTLSKRELRSGLAETLKHGLILDEYFYEYVEYNIEKIFNYNVDILQYIAKMNCVIKGKVVEEDEREGDLRAILNFGHTIGHAVESVSNFELLHGECVAVGIIGAYKMAQYLEMVNEETVNKVTQTIEKVGLPTKLSGINVEKVYEQMFYDKKVRKDKLVFILPKKIGKVVKCVIDDENLVKTVLGEIIN